MRQLLYTLLLLGITHSATSQCFIDYFDATIGSCNLNNNYQVTGTVSFINAPATGALLIEVDNGVMTFDTIVNAPFTSPQSYSISSIPADGNNITVQTYFQADPTCQSSVAATAPPSCQCTVDVGTFNYTINGNSNQTYILTAGDTININSNLDYIYPPQVVGPPITYDPGIAFLIYSCMPSTVDFWTDPCFMGFGGYAPNFQDINGAGLFGGTGPTNIYYVPLTMYSVVDGIYSVTSTSATCYEMGYPINMIYLTPIVGTPTPNPTNGQVNINVSGAMPAYNGSNFSISNLTPPTATLDLTTVPNNGNFVISGLNSGETYSVDVMDSVGSILTITNAYLDLENLTNKEPNIYFDQGTNILTIDLPYEIGSDAVIMSATGQVVKQISSEAGSINDLNDLTDGLYFVVVSYQNQIYKKKIIK